MADLVGYRFPRREQRGLLAGLRGGQLAALAVGLVVAVAALGNFPPVPGALLAVGAGGGGAVVAFFPVGGAPLESWLPVAIRWVGRGVAGHQEVVSLSSVRRGLGPRSLADCRILGTPKSRDGHRVGVLHDCGRQTAAAVAAVQCVDLTLLDADEQDRWSAAWSACLAALAGSGDLQRLQWLVRSEPAVPTRSGDAAEGPSSHQEVEDAIRSRVRRHSVVVAASVDVRSAGRGLWPQGWGGPAAGELCETAARALRVVEEQLSQAGLVVEGALAPAGLAALVGCVLKGTATGPPWPLAVDERWDRLRCDGVWHATYWIAEWPGVEVRPGFLVPLLHAATGSRSVSLTMQAVSPSQAVRQAEAAHTAEVADAERRHRAGILDTARRRLEREGVVDREAALASGHSLYRVNGFVTVSAPGAAELELECERTEQSAARSHLELRRLYGRQAEALGWVLPLGRGLA